MKYFFFTFLIFPAMLMAAPTRIISLSSALTGTVDALGYGAGIVAVDVTSEYPAYVKALPKVSRNRALSVEGILMFRPDIVLAPEGDISRAMALQLKNAGVRLVTIRQEFSISGASRFIRDVASALQETGKGESLAQKTETACQSIISRIHAAAGKTPKVVFIYARGAGTMSVAGKGSNMDAIIQLAGGKNAIGEFSDFKPYSTEALIKANPDIILMFDFGAGSLGGRSSILKMPGVMLTTAGKQDRIVEVDAQLMVNFSTRLPEAIKDLNARLFGS